MSVRCLRWAVAGLASVMCGSAVADPLIDNINEPTSATTIFGTVAPDLIWAAQEFSTPQRATLNDIVLSAGLAVGGPDIFAELRVGPDPTGPVLTALAVPALQELFTEPASFTPVDVVELVPGEQYWIVVGVLTTGAFGWDYSSTQDTLGPGSLGNYWYSFDLGASWSNFGNFLPYKLLIDVTFIPCAADFNGDGFVDFFDFDDFVSCFEGVVCPPGRDSDFNGDGFVDFFDFDDFVTAYEAGC